MSTIGYPLVNSMKCKQYDKTLPTAIGISEVGKVLYYSHAISSISVDGILADPASKPVMVSWFGEDPGPAPPGSVPAKIEAREMPYIRQLLDAYGEREQCTFRSHKDIKDHGDHAPHHGVIDVHRAKYVDSLARVDAAMTQAANVQPSGALAKYARVPVNQGICHHFANEGQPRWQKK
jgi:hypothetical protein